MFKTVNEIHNHNTVYVNSAPTQSWTPDSPRRDVGASAVVAVASFSMIAITAPIWGSCWLLWKGRRLLLHALFAVVAVGAVMLLAIGAIEYIFEIATALSIIVLFVLVVILTRMIVHQLKVNKESAKVARQEAQAREHALRMAESQRPVVIMVNNRQEAEEAVKRHRLEQVKPDSIRVIEANQYQWNTAELRAKHTAEQPTRKIWAEERTGKPHSHA